MKPAIGRIVWYQAHGSPDGTHKPEPRAAVVTEVYDDLAEFGGDTVVGLCVLSPAGLFFNRTVHFDDSSEPKGGTWRWPPRQ